MSRFLSAVRPDQLPLTPVPEGVGPEISYVGTDAGQTPLDMLPEVAEESPKVKERAPMDENQIKSICSELRSKYSACDIADALLKLRLPSAGALADVASVRKPNAPETRIVAPVSTVLYVPKPDVDNSTLSPGIQPQSNIPKGQNWTDIVSPGTVSVIQQPKGQAVALIGDIMVTRLNIRGILGCVVDGRSRDVESCTRICERGPFQLWSLGFSAAGPSQEALPWSINVPLKIGNVTVEAGDILCADEMERAVVVIPRKHLDTVLELLPTLKEASENVLKAVEAGSTLPEAVKENPNFYSNYK